MASAATSAFSVHDHLLCVGPQVSVKLHLDDPLDAIAVHAWNGTWGVIAVGFFASQRLIQVRRLFWSPLAVCAMHAAAPGRCCSPTTDTAAGQQSQDADF